MNFLYRSSLPALLVFSIALTLFSCKDDNSDSSEFPISEGSVVIPSLTSDTLLYVAVNEDIVPVYITIPQGCNLSSYPAVVVMHGSGGMWKDDDREAGVMSSQNRDWQNIFNDNCIIGAFVDSYTPRGCVERVDAWKEAPLAFKISSQFIRPLDAYAALDLLRRLVNGDDAALVNKGNEGILGFSDGATALAATLYDTESTPTDWEWTQSYDKTYTEADGILPPAEKPADGGFACGVFYYGGSVGNSYWGGNPCSSNEFIYQNYAPILYQLPANGYLTENTLCAFDVLASKNAPVEKYVYDNAEHGFDGDDTNQMTQSELARSRTIDWFKQYLNIN